MYLVTDLCFIHALLMLSDYLKMINLDSNMSELEGCVQK
jgi:hypothetical protein